MKSSIGIGSLIIFIAVVLISAVAANILIQVSSNLQQKALLTGRNSLYEVSSGVRIVTIYGYANLTTLKVEKLAILLEPSPGSRPIDINVTKVMISDTKILSVLSYNSSAYYVGGDLFNNTAWDYLDNKSFGIVVLNDLDGSIRRDTPVMNRGDRIAIIIDVGKVFGGLVKGDYVYGKVKPEFGVDASFGFYIPSLIEEVIILG